MTLRLRLFFVVAIVIALHTCTLIVLLAQDARESARIAQQVQGEWVGKSLAQILASSLITNDLATVQSTVKLLFSEKRFLKLEVLDDRGRSIIDLQATVSTQNEETPPWFLAYLNIVVEPSVQTVDVGGVEYGKIITVVSPGPIVQRVWSEAQRDAWVALATIAILLLLLWALLEVGLRPLQLLSTTVQRIGAGDFSVRLAQGANREFSRLISVVNDMAAQISALLEKTRTLAASEVQARRLQEFHAITNSPQDLEITIQAVLKMASEALAMPFAAVSVVSEDACNLLYAYPVKPTAQMIGYAERLCRYETHSFHDSDIQAVPVDCNGTGIRASIGVPVHVQGRFYGTLNFFSPVAQAAPFHLGDLEFAKLVTQWLGMAIQQEQDERSLWEEKERAQVTLASIGDAVITTDVNGAITYLNAAAEGVTGWTLCDAGSLPLTQVFQIVHEDTRKPADNTVEQCLRENRMVELAANTVLIRRDGSECAIEDSAAPIKDRHGKTIGAVLVFHDVTPARTLLHQLEHHASHDQLTDLPNRRMFESTLERVLDNARFSKNLHALCYLDLDQFKAVNDACGHLAGDLLLRQVTDLLRKRLRGTDILARLGGDEFGLIMTHITEEQALTAAEEIRAMVAEFRFAWQDRCFQIGVSIGLVMIDATVQGIVDIMRLADNACYAAKADGRNRVHLFRDTDGELSRSSRKDLPVS